MNQEEKEMLGRALEALCEFIRDAVETIESILNAISENIKMIVEATEKFHLKKNKNAPHRIKYLAFHAKKKRIRKKNLARLWAYD